MALDRSWSTVVRLAWSLRREHHGLLAAFRAARTTATDYTRQENERREADAQTTDEEWTSRREEAARTFHKRHSS